MTDQRPILLYDGHCSFCLREAQRLARWVQGRVRLESFRDPAVLARYPELSAEACAEAIHLVSPDGRTRRGAEAVAATLRLRPAWAPIWWIYHLPLLRQLLDRGYAAIARNRFRLSAAVCADDACRLHHQAR